MKVRMVKPGERYRFMARSSNIHTLSRLENLIAHLEISSDLK